MSAKHTPGPWVARPDPNAISSDDWCVGIGDSLENIDKVAVCSERDARLIAAAPELLAKCEKVVAWLDRLAERSEQSAKDKRFLTLAEAHAADAKNYRSTADDIRAAIAKATGGAA